LVLIAALLAAYGYPWQYGDEINFSGIGPWLLLGRIPFLVGAFVLLLAERPPKAADRTERSDPAQRALDTPFPR
jgi:hypothetical protein